jgi:hypothetical protein
MLFIVMLNKRVAVTELTSVKSTVKLLVPATLEVPEIVPVLEAKDSPLGRLPEEMDQEYGGVPPVPASVAL